MQSMSRSCNVASKIILRGDPSFYPFLVYLQHKISSKIGLLFLKKHHFFSNGDSLFKR